MALVLSKHLELQSNTSIKKFIHECKKITDARLLNKITGKELRIRAQINPKTLAIISKLQLLT